MDWSRGGKPGRTAIDRVIGSRVRARRTQLKLGQLQLASRIGLRTAQSVGALEAGKNKFSAGRLKLTARALHCSIGWLVGEDGAPEQTEADRWWTTKVAVELMNAVIDLNPPHRDRVAKRTTMMMRQIKSDMDSAVLTSWLRLLRIVGPKGFEQLNRWGAAAVENGMLHENNAHRAVEVFGKWNGDRTQNIIAMLEAEFEEDDGVKKP